MIRCSLFVPLLAAFAMPASGLDKPVPAPEAPVAELRIVPRPRPATFGVTIHTDRQNYEVGEGVRVTFRTTADSYVYIYTTDPRGHHRQIFPNFYDRDNFARAGVTYSIPDNSYDLVAEGPSGRETISITAVRQKFHTMHRYEDFSNSDPFPSRSSVSMHGVVPRERRYDTIAEDSTSIYIRGPRIPRPEPHRYHEHQHINTEGSNGFFYR